MFRVILVYKVCSTAQKVQHKVLYWYMEKNKLFLGGNYFWNPSDLYLTYAANSLWIDRISFPQWSFREQSWQRLHQLVAPQCHGMGFPRDSVVKNPPDNAEDAGDEGSISGLGRSPGGGNGNPLQYSCLKNSMHRGAWQATVHGVTKSWTQLSDHARTPWDGKSSGESWTSN